MFIILPFVKICLNSYSKSPKVWPLTGHVQTTSCLLKAIAFNWITRMRVSHFIILRDIHVTSSISGKCEWLNPRSNDNTILFLLSRHWDNVELISQKNESYDSLRCQKHTKSILENQLFLKNRSSSTSSDPSVFKRKCSVKLL